MGRNYKNRIPIELKENKIAGQEMIPFFISQHYDDINKYILTYYDINKGISKEDMYNMLISIFDELKDVIDSKDLPVYTLPYIGKIMPSRSRIIINYINIKVKFLLHRINPFLYAQCKIVYGNFFRNYADKTDRSLKFKKVYKDNKKIDLIDNIENYIEKQVHKKLEKYKNSEQQSYKNNNKLS